MWFYFLFGGFFIVMGLAVHVLKWCFLISGYNMMSKKQKANVDTKDLGRLIGFYSYFNGGMIIVSGLLHALGFSLGIAPSIVLFAVSIVYLSMILNNKYLTQIPKENPYNISTDFIWDFKPILLFFLGTLGINSHLHRYSTRAMEVLSSNSQPEEPSPWTDG